jgi:DNA-binding IclR family transcriptional regulator
MSSISGSGERILAILDLFTEASPEWTSEEMRVALGYSRPTLYRYLKTLKEAGFLMALPHSGYMLGPRVTELDFLSRRSDPLIEAGRPHLRALTAAHPGVASLVRWYGRKLLCVASEDSSPVTLSSYPRGRPMPLARGAISRAILAWLPKRDQEAIVAEHEAEFAAPRETVLAMLRDTRRDGVAVAWGEVTPGVVGVAAPVLAADRAPVAALCLTSDAATMAPARLAAIRDTIKEMAADISMTLRAGNADQAMNG